MILTKNFLEQEAKERNIGFTYEHKMDVKVFGYSIKENYDLFLSHSFLDRILIETLIEIFKDAGYSVYVDWNNDPNLDRDNVNAKTANVIKDRIKNCKGLSYIATDNIVNSKWCPWELGLGDGMLNGNVCILPILGTSMEFKGTEYVGLYPYLEYKKEISDFIVVDAEDSSNRLTLRKWLEKK